MSLSKRLSCLAFLAAGALALGHCKDKSGPGSEARGVQGELCEHGVVRDICPKCNPKLAAVFQTKGDWCKEHGFPESVCPVCHPERKGRPSPKTERKDEHEELPKKVRLDPEVAREAGVVTSPVTRERLVPSVSLPGELAADPDRIGKLSSPIAGRIERVLFREGSVVKKGDVLSVLRVPELGKLRGAYASSSARTRAARANAERLRDLASTQLATQQAYLDAKAEAESQEAQRRALGDELSALGAGGGEGGPYLLSLRAPVGGVVVSRDAVVGQPLASEHVLATIADLSEVWFLGRVFEKDLSRLHQGAKTEVQLNAFPADFFKGTLEYVGQQIDPYARTITARVRVANPNGQLRLGLFGAARVEVQKGTDASPVLVVPRTALMDVAGKTVVFVLHADGDYELHEVVLGESAPGKVQIVAGLREGEQVVVQGAFTLKSIVLKATMKDDD